MLGSTNVLLVTGAACALMDELAKYLHVGVVALCVIPISGQPDAAGILLCQLSNASTWSSATCLTSIVNWLVAAGLV